MPEDNGSFDPLRLNDGAHYKVMGTPRANTTPSTPVPTSTLQLQAGASTSRIAGPGMYQTPLFAPGVTGA